MPDEEYNPLEDADFQAASLQDKFNYLKANDADFAKASPKDQSDYLNHIHYSGARAPKVPSTEPGEVRKPAYVREATLGALGTVAPETEHPLRDMGKSILEQATSPSEIAKTAATGGIYPIAKMGLGLGQQLYGATKEVAPVVTHFLYPFSAPTPTPEQKETAAHGAGTLGGFAAMAAAPELREKAAEYTAPMRNRMATRIGQSIYGPSPKNIFPSQEPAPATVAEGPVAYGRKGLIANLGERVGDLNARVRTVLHQSTLPPEPLAPIVDRATQPLIDLARRNGEEARAVAIENWRDNYLKNRPNAVNLEDLKGLQDDISKVGKTFKGGTEEDANIKAAKQGLYSEIKNVLEQRIPGISEYTEREAGLLKGKEMLANQERLARGGPVLPSPRLFMGEYGGPATFTGMSLRFGLPEGILPKTLAIKALGSRVPLPDINPAFGTPPPMPFVRGLLPAGPQPTSPIPIGGGGFIPGNAGPGIGPIPARPSPFSPIAGSEPTPTGGMRGFPSAPQPPFQYGGSVRGIPAEPAVPSYMRTERMLPPAGSIQVGPSSLPQSLALRPAMGPVLGEIPRGAELPPPEALKPAAAEPARPLASAEMPGKGIVPAVETERSAGNVGEKQTKSLAKAKPVETAKLPQERAADISDQMSAKQAELEKATPKEQVRIKRQIRDLNSQREALAVQVEAAAPVNPMGRGETAVGGETRGKAGKGGEGTKKTASTASLGMSAYDAIQSGKELQPGEFIRFDERPLKSGDAIPNSRIWKEGEPTRKTLPGVSAIDPHAELNGSDRYNLKGTYYDGKPYVVSGTLVKKGFDSGEVILKNAKVVRELSSPTPAAETPRGEIPGPIGRVKPPKKAGQK